MTEMYRHVDDDGFCLSARLLPDLNNGGVTDTLSITVEGSDEPQSIQIRSVDASAVAAGILRAAGMSPATDQPALRDRIRRAVCEAEGFGWDTDMLEPDEYGEIADTVLAVLPAVDRAAVLREAADWFDSGSRGVTRFFGHQAAAE
ncbi:hypothetical protein, partial [Streptomyces antibioticus]|uniref:hypothetical protein n=1 Tax=Streptomyces antibioticus TaxID=1890 RepID=UPI003400D67D